MFAYSWNANVVVWYSWLGSQGNGWIARLAGLRSRPELLGEQCHTVGMGAPKLGGALTKLGHYR